MTDRARFEHAEHQCPNGHADAYIDTFRDQLICNECDEQWTLIEVEVAE